ncbi:BZ3500_MvSof-1268-A1-R1_Chr1-1g00915 [Microbotryum saponariae]|uniref:Histone-lysine N-methyltransferase, H3 lysine-79 specific n=1 Tax=Microbotryum saponariae TaxID=289078 RepID=A0A2X0MCZ4_9BASI|nr:BZ3500_MvSof-1268-A1-R1_Chr1-1g00915 [Microbotryum saponariae]SCZ92926.1 BZ3501_MvSof-1269-A2-R1_Chr1-1g00512 [Microbotryum saponariae]
MFQRRKSFQSGPSASSSAPTGSTSSGTSTVPGPPKKLIQVLTTRKTVLVPSTLTKAVNSSPSSSKVGVKTAGPSLKHRVSNGASAVATTTTSSSSSSSSKAKNNNSLAGPSSSSDKSARAITSASSPKKLNGGSAQSASPIKRKAEAVVSAEANKHIKSASTSPARSQAAHKTKKRATSSALTRSSSDVDSSSSAASPSEEEGDSDSSDSDTPRNRRQSTPVVERDVYDGSEAVTEAENKGTSKRIDASKLVMLSRSAYRDYFIDPIDPEKSNVQWSGNDIPTIELEYPGNGSEKSKLTRPGYLLHRFYLLAPKNDNEYDPIEDVMTVIRTVLDVFLAPPQSLALFGYTPGLNSFSAFLSAPPSRSATPGTPTDTGTPSSATFLTSTLPPLMRQLEKAKAKRDGPAFIAAIERYNAGIKELKANSIMKQNIQGLKGLKEKTWTKIAAQSYDRAVGPGLDELSKYEAFSDNVYGELLPKFMSEIFQKTKLGPGSVFVDLGSGVGNCVVQAALATGCEAWGFENMAHASSLARAQVVEAETRHKLWGVSAGKMEVIEADFCEHPLVGQVLKRADVILVNNEVFSSLLNQRLSLLFLDLASGTRIVSLKAFAHSFNLSAHNRHSPLAILDQGQPLTYGRQSVSWKEEGGKYFIGRIDREKVARFDEKERRRREKREKAERVERGSEENVG